MPSDRKVDVAKVRRTLQRVNRRGEIARIRNRADIMSYSGFPLAIGKELLLMQNTADFSLDGYVVMPLREMRLVVSSDVQRFQEKVMRENKQLRKVRQPSHAVALDGWRSCVKSLAAANRVVVVNCDFKNREVEEDIYIGAILGVSDNELAIHPFDASADWYDGVEVVPFADVSSIEFGDVYSTAFLKYLPALP